MLRVAEEATEQLNVNGVGEPTVVLAAVGLRGIPPTQPQPLTVISDASWHLADMPSRQHTNSPTVKSTRQMNYRLPQLRIR